MEIKCYKCFYTINRDKYIDGVLVEEYQNVFGTYCPNCKNFIAPLKKYGIYKLQKENELKKEIMRQEVINRIKNKLKGDS